MKIKHIFTIYLNTFSPIESNHYTLTLTLIIVYNEKKKNAD